MSDYGYVSVDKLCDFANNSTVGLTANDIMRFPRADVKIKKYGTWITVHPVDISKEFKCTACQGLIELPVFAKECYYAFCPNCGAEMKRGMKKIYNSYKEKFK